MPDRVDQALDVAGRVAPATGGVIAPARVATVEPAGHWGTASARAPGAVETELSARMRSDEIRRVYHPGIPLDRYGTLDQTALAAVYPASGRSGCVAGHVLSTDGGFLAAGVMHGHSGWRR